jgi:hypothetical protein
VPVWIETCIHRRWDIIGGCGGEGLCSGEQDGQFKTRLPSVPPTVPTPSLYDCFPDS